MKEVIFTMPVLIDDDILELAKHRIVTDPDAKITYERFNR